jgi:hypothetical protein
LSLLYGHSVVSSCGVHEVICYSICNLDLIFLETMPIPAKNFERESHKLNLNFKEILIEEIYLERDIAFE